MAIIAQADGTLLVTFHILGRRMYHKEQLNPHIEFDSLYELAEMISELQRLDWCIGQEPDWTNHTRLLQKDYDEINDLVDEIHYELMGTEWDQVRTYEEGFWNVINKALGVKEEE